ncbi:hypothetical protein B0F90DRAFT_1668336 [Multifurca ochricompacta]|uniref:Protein kinase domain-containing protein n=1 Tax=Multifurca ochricompacta TaxID=376703 RepID=A0AAD4QNC8_9AGAM|nr:hypothetical protein B0F90DRAFT_1668336 [Multifurca ochricompacta]
MSKTAHKHTASVVQNQKARLTTAYNELGKELSSTKVKVVGNYTLGKVLGEGAYGKVRLGTHRLTSTRVAIKQIPKVLSATLTREIHHHRQLHHPHITQLYEVIATENSIWLVTELCSGGELFDYLTEKGRILEEETRHIFGQICLAVNYLHEKGIVHRDLKLENVLLDERCRIKLGDFGFTREFDRGAYLETYCGTTGYAAPEMLEGKKYLGPGNSCILQPSSHANLALEVDVWSLGVILYCLLTGGLPFDDDDESVMRAMVIKGEFEDPEWLSDHVRDLLRKILRKDPIKRITIPQLLAHPWFTSPSSPTNTSHAVVVPQPIQAQPSATTSESSATSELSFRSASSELDVSSATTLDDVSHDSAPDENPQMHRHPSQSTIRKTVTVEGKKPSHPETVMEENFPYLTLRSSSASRSPRIKEPPALPTRTPVRTKRRSVSSNLSDPSSPAGEKTMTSFPPQDFASLLGVPAPIIFGTKLERELLNNLSSLGFDTGQIVHSVLSDACDAASAMWWMLMRRAERKVLEEASSRPEHRLLEREAREVDTKARESAGRKRGTTDPETPSTVRAEPLPSLSALSAPDVAFIPPTPTSTTHTRASAKTPPRVASPSHSLLSPTSPTADPQPKSHPPTPGGNSKEKDKDKDKGKREGKVRSGSVSIMQRATTALEAAGLVRKKSAEIVKDDKLKEKEGEKRGTVSDEPRHSHSSGKLVKLPPSRETPAPGTPSVDQEVVANAAAPSSPWVLARLSNASPPEISPTPSPGDTLTSLPQISPKEGGQHRNRASLLTAFRMWFNEDRRGKRKSAANGVVNAPYAHGMDSRTPSSSGAGRNSVKAKRRTSGGGGTSRKGHRAKGPSISSRRSSSVNSRRSSTASMAQVAMESPQFTFEHMVAMSRQRSDPSRRSFGSRTPNSERGEYNSSRPSSVHSYTVGKHRHRKSPSASSAGSLQLARATSPYHRRAGSGSSTRVVRSPTQGAPRAPHLRSNSTASSVHSLPSSRHGSFYEQSESEAQRTGSPLRPHSRNTLDNTLDETPRRSHPHGNTTFVAQKRQTPFQPPLLTGSYSASSRSSWKKSWGLEPPGWQTRTARLPIEVLSISPPGDATVLRDVFTGRPSLSPDDDDEWVDVDDEPGYVGGLGQTPATTASFFSTGSSASPVDSTFGGYPLVESPIMLAAPPRVPGSARTPKGKRAGKVSSNRTKPGTPPIGRMSPLPSEISLDGVPEARGGRRQLPNARPGPAFKHAIQEEDEDEGEE